MRTVCLWFLVLFFIILINGDNTYIGKGKLSIEENEQLQKTCGHYSGTITTRLGCSATLISNRHVLTAWHCLIGITTSLIYRLSNPVDHAVNKDIVNIDGFPFAPEILNEESTVTFDKFRFVFDNNCASENTGSGCSVKDAVIRKAIKVTSPKLLARNLVQGHMDMAIFELEEPVEFSQDLYPACLSETRPQMENVLSLFSYGSDGTFFGTLDGSLQSINVTNVPCYKNKGLDSICLVSNHMGTAGGDSGGGFVYNKNGRTYVTGVVSGAIAITENYKEHHDTAIAHHLHWICTHIGICVDETKTEQIPTFINTITTYV